VLGAFLAAVAPLDAPGWLVGPPTILAIFLAPGVGWQNLRGNLRLDPEAIGIAVAMSIGCVIVLGLGMNAVRLTLNQTHWSVALAVVVMGLGAGGLVRPSQHDAPRKRVALPTRRRIAALAVMTTCIVGAAGGALIAWFSQQLWLDRQHYTELYATGTAELQRVTVNNHEGRSVSYLARIAAAGEAPRVVSFTLNDGGTWTGEVAVDPGRATDALPMLDVKLARVGVPGVYRFIRLLRPQPTAQPTF
jgi:hypothetical protein